MTPKRFWMLVSLGGFLMLIGGIIASVVLTIETGEKRPDSECSSMRAAVLTVCYTSDDPKVLLGVVPALVGGSIMGIGIWRWVTAANVERALADSDDPGAPPGTDPPTGTGAPPPPPDPAHAENPLEAYEELRAKGKRRRA